MAEKFPVDEAYAKIMRYMGWERKNDPVTKAEIRDVLNALWGKAEETGRKNEQADIVRRLDDVYATVKKQFEIQE